MVPKFHILYGAIFTLLIWFFAPSISYISLALIFLSSFLIDFDHYVSGAIKCKTLNFKKVVDYNYNFMYQQIKNLKKGIRIRENFNLFHTVEFHLLVAILGIFFTPFFYIFIGMTFHSLLDLYDLMSRKLVYSREFFFFNWVRRSLFSKE
jgi:hypothetical protein